MDYTFIEGEGVPIVFLHGFLLDKSEFMFLTDYLYNPMLFVTMFGFGLGPPPKKPLFVKDYADGIAKLLGELKLTRAIFVCHSFGARVVAILASEHPELVQKIMIVDGAGLKPRRGLKYYFAIWRYKHLKKLVARGKADKKELEAFGSSDYKALSPVMKQTFINVVNEDLAPYFRRIRCQTLLFWGRRDNQTPLYMAKRLNKLIKGSHLVVVEGGHFSFLDDMPTFIATLVAFVAN